ncbi:MAG: glutaredoxin domain-containing protein [Nitrospinota bacterium]
MSEGPKVFIYTTDPCGYCRMAKSLLDKMGVEYEEKMVFGGTPEWEEMLRVTGGAKTVPQVTVDGQVVGGYPDLLRLQKSGELDALFRLA